MTEFNDINVFKNALYNRNRYTCKKKEVNVPGHNNHFYNSTAEVQVSFHVSNMHVSSLLC